MLHKAAGSPFHYCGYQDIHIRIQRISRFGFGPFHFVSQAPSGDLCIISHFAFCTTVNWTNRSDIRPELPEIGSFYLSSLAMQAVVQASTNALARFRGQPSCHALKFSLLTSKNRSMVVKKVVDRTRRTLGPMDWTTMPKTSTFASNSA